MGTKVETWEELELELEEDIFKHENLSRNRLRSQITISHNILPPADTTIKTTKFTKGQNE